MAFRPFETLGSEQFTILIWCMWGTGLLLTVVRLFLRFHHQRRWFWDDAFQVQAMVSLTALSTVTYLQRDTIHHKDGAHHEGHSTEKEFKEGDTDETNYQANLQFISIVLFWTCLWSIKGSLLLFYRRLFFNLKAYMKWWWLVAITCMVTFVACILANFLECLPLALRFRFGLEGSCTAMHGTMFLAFTTAFDVLTDICLMILPLQLLKGLHISKSQKIGIGCIFMLSILTVTFSVCRVSEVYKSLSLSDPNFNAKLSLWSILEASIAVVVGALPSLKLLAKRKEHSSPASFSPQSRSLYLPRPGNTPRLRTMQTKVHARGTNHGWPRNHEYSESQGDQQGIMLGSVRGRGIAVTRDVLVSSDEGESKSGDGVSVVSFSCMI